MYLWLDLSISLCSPLSKVPRPLRPLVSRPYIVNWFSRLFPAVVGAGTIAWVVVLIYSYHIEAEAYLQLQSMLTTAADQFDADQGNAVDFVSILKNALRYIEINKLLVTRVKSNSYWWVATHLLTLCVS